MKLLIFAAILAIVAAEGCWKGTYGRGAGRGIYACASGLEKSGLLCYPKCRSGYKGVGPVCWGSFPKSYGRGWGKPLQCGPRDDMSGLLCYPPCKRGYQGAGPVCW